MSDFKVEFQPQQCSNVLQQKLLQLPEICKRDNTEKRAMLGMFQRFMKMSKYFQTEFSHLDRQEKNALGRSVSLVKDEVRIS